jgi:signal peptidase I
MRSSTGIIAAGAAAALLISAARTRLLVIHVRGTSMMPTFHPDETVLAVRRRRGGRVRAGQAVVCRLPDGVPGPTGLVIKRVVAVAGEVVPGTTTAVPARHVHIEGDGPRSYDSRQFGPLPMDSVVGHVIARLSTRGRPAEPG